MELKPEVTCFYKSCIIHLYTQINDIKQELFIKIHNHLQVSAVLLSPQTDYNYIKIYNYKDNIKIEISVFTSCLIVSYY